MVNGDISSHFLHNFVNPKSIAIFGANEKIPENMGAFQLLTLIDNGYSGKIYPIHPKLSSVFGKNAYRSVKEVPGKIDLAEIILSKQHVPQILKDLGEHDCHNVIIVSAGYREQNNVQGREEILDIAKKYDMHILGPNCIGILNTHCHFSNDPQETCILNTTVQSYNQKAGNVSIISQSGTFVSHVFMVLEERDLHLSKTFSVGNEADIDICDCLSYLGDDPETDVILIYIEEIKRGRLFFNLARKISLKKPIVCLYVGGSEGGAKAAMSHTGSIGGNDAVFNGMIKQTGIIRVSSLEELVDTAMIFAKLLPQNVLPKGKRIAVVTNSGGPGATMADRCSRLGLEIPDFSPELQAKLKRYMPPTAQITNPLDYTFSLNPVFFYQSVPKIIAKSKEVDAMLVYGALGESFFSYEGVGADVLQYTNNKKKMKDWLSLSRESIKSARRIMKKYSFPIINVNFLGIKEPIFQFLNSIGFPSFKMPHQAVLSLNNMIQYYIWISNQKNK
ncbi:acetate--CoA ligase family protein [Candidatus Harpocratesius sp.]